MQSTTFSMKDYVAIMEEIQLTEEQQQAVSAILTEGLVDAIGKKSLVGFLKIIKALWDAGWYTVVHPIKTVKNVVKTTKYAIGAGIAAGAAYGTYAIKPFVDDAYMIWQLGQRFAQTLGDIKLTSLSSIKAAFQSLQQLPNLANWSSLTIDQKVQIMKQLGLSSDAYGDLLKYVFEIASQFVLDNAWVILALSLTMIAARYISRFVSNKLQGQIDKLSGDKEKKDKDTKIEPTLDPASLDSKDEFKKIQ